MTSYSKIRRPGHVTPRFEDHLDKRRSASTRTVRPRGSRSLAFGAAVLIAAAIVGGAGGAGAAGLLTGRNIRDDSLRSADFRDGSVGAAKVRIGGLSQTDVGFDLTGDQGPPGDTGPSGLPGIRAITVRSGPPVSRTGDVLAVADCVSGEIALSGGAQLDAADPGVLPYILSSSRSSLGRWQSVISSTLIGLRSYTPWVVCAQLP